MTRRLVSLTVVIVTSTSVWAQEPIVPGPAFKAIIDLKSAGAPAMSPDGVANGR